MPIVLSRIGELGVPDREIPQEQRNAVWSRIVKNWTEKNPEQFLELLETEKAKGRCKLIKNIQEED